MKTILSFLVLFISLNTFSQVKKLEATNKVTGKSVYFEDGQRVKLTTSDRKKMVGFLTINDLQTISVNGIETKTENISSIKYFPKGGRTAKNIFLGAGASLLAGSGVAAAFSDGSAFALFAGGTASIITGSLLNNKNKSLIYRNYMFKIVEQ
ncbi:hypothetical protein [Flavobacterium sp.]|uniref:hypothetical protein n=1 Tax=Flavobacterium sp. TaxID=239 RepID=UPI0038FC8BB7